MNSDKEYAGMYKTINEHKKIDYRANAEVVFKDRDNRTTAFEKKLTEIRIKLMRIFYFK